MGQRPKFKQGDKVNFDGRQHTITSDGGWIHSHDHNGIVWIYKIRDANGVGMLAKESQLSLTASEPRVKKLIVPDKEKE